MVKTNQMY